MKANQTLTYDQRPMYKSPMYKFMYQFSIHKLFNWGLAVVFGYTLMLASAPVYAQEISYNAGVTSNYIWRGVTQTNDNPAAFIGADADFGNGFYLGTWVANVDFEDNLDTANGAETSFELDLYGGYAGEIANLNYDIGYIAYVYPDADFGNEADFSEVYLTLGQGPISASVYYLVDADYDADSGDDVYYSLDFEFDLIGDWDIGLHAGMYNYKDGSNDYDDYGLFLTKDEITISLTDTDQSDTDPDLAISYTLGF